MKKDKKWKLSSNNVECYLQENEIMLKKNVYDT